MARRGLDALQGHWSRIHVEPGWENALEAALRERLGALEVSRLDMVRAFAADGPPAKLAFYSPPLAGAPEQPAALARLSDLLRLNDAGQKALLSDWLHGCHAAQSLEEALAERERLQPGEVIFVRSGTTGRYFAALRGSETAAASIGINGTRQRILLFSLSAGIAGLAGGLVAMDPGVGGFGTQG